MDNDKIIASHIYVLVKEVGVHSEYILEHINYGKLLLPIKIRIRKHTSSSKVIAVKFRDSYKWEYCRYHKFRKIDANKDVFAGQRTYGKYNCDLEIKKHNGNNTLQIDVLNPNSTVKHQP